MQTTIKIFLLTLCSLLTFEAQANVTAVTTTITTATKNVVLGRSTTAVITWRVTDSTSLPVSTTVSSPQGRFCTSLVACKTILGTVNKTVSKTYISAGMALSGGPTTKTLSVRENLLIPASIVQKAHKNGDTTFIYERTFNSTQGGGNVAASITLRITGSAAAGFFISRVALRFDDQTPLKLVSKNEELSIEADISFNRSGLIRAVWEVADPSSTTGKPIFRPLRSIHKYLVSGDFETLQGPNLPTKKTGMYLARLRIIEPAISFTLPQIQYFVNTRPQGVALPAKPIDLVTPPPMSRVTPQLMFRWQPIKGAKVYQLEIYADESSPLADSLPDIGSSSDSARPKIPKGARPLAGLVTPGDSTQTTLSPTVSRHLQPRQRYLWRVIAIGQNGDVIGKSGARQIRMP